MLQSVRPDASAPVATTETRSLAGPRPRSASRAGVEAMVPFILGLSPVALIVGATIGEHEARWARLDGRVADLQRQRPRRHRAGAARRRRRRRHPDRAGRQHPGRGLRLRRGGALAAPTALVPAPGARPPRRPDVRGRRAPRRPPPRPHGATPVLPRRWSHPRRRVLGAGHDRDARGRPARRRARARHHRAAVPGRLARGAGAGPAGRRGRHARGPGHRGLGRLAERDRHARRHRRRCGRRSAGRRGRPR